VWKWLRHLDHLLTR